VCLGNEAKEGLECLILSMIYVLFSIVVLITFLSPFISCTTSMKHRTGECGLMVLWRKHTTVHLLTVLSTYLRFSFLNKDYLSEFIAIGYDGTCMILILIY